jgi:hypothetical protein
LDQRRAFVAGLGGRRARKHGAAPDRQGHRTSPGIEGR